MDDIKEYVNYIATSWYIHSALIDDAWTLGQE